MPAQQAGEHSGALQTQGSSWVPRANLGYVAADALARIGRWYLRRRTAFADEIIEGWKAPHGYDDIVQEQITEYLRRV